MNNKLRKEVRESDVLIERLETCLKIIGDLCQKNRGIKMSLPVKWDDEDVFMGITIRDAIARLKNDK